MPISGHWEAKIIQRSGLSSLIGVGCEPFADKGTRQVREGVPGIYTGQKKEGASLNLWLVEV